MTKQCLQCEKNIVVGRTKFCSECLRQKQLDLHDILFHEIKIKYFERHNNDIYNNIKFDFAYLTTKLLKKFNDGFS